MSGPAQRENRRMIVRECDKQGARRGRGGYTGLCRLGRKTMPTLGHQDHAPFHRVVKGRGEGSTLPVIFAHVCKHLGCPQGAVLLLSSPQSFPGSCLWASRHLCCSFSPCSPPCCQSVPPTRMQAPVLPQQMSSLWLPPRFSCMPMAPCLPHALHKHRRFGRRWAHR